MSIPPSPLSEALQQSTGPLLLMEVIPPLRKASEDQVFAWRDQIVSALAGKSLLAVNIPEVRDETREGERTFTYEKRIKPREFGRLLQESFTEPIGVIINRVVAHRPIEQQRDWLENTSRDWNIRNLILVGGESSRVTYPGPSVSGMARLISQEINPLLPEGERWCCGGICIPTRRRSDSEQDEPNRLLKKAQAGLDFFSTQIIYESDSFCRLLSDYSALCAEQNETPRRLFLSLAPVQNQKHIEFLRWLGVDVPPGVEAELLQNDQAVGQAALQVCLRIAKQVLAFNQQLAMPVPLGFNVSPLMRPNFGLAVELLEGLSALSKGIS